MTLYPDQRRATGRTYATAFPLTENPIAESGRWISGGSTGVYLDVRTTPNHAFGSNVSAAPPFTDPTAVLTGPWGRIQTAEAVVIVPATSAQNQEVELRLLTTISGAEIVGYECLFSVSSNPYTEIVRWDVGASTGNFVSLTGGSVLAPQALATGNRIKATITAAGLITIYADYGSGYQSIASVTDTTYPSGAPGIGMFQHGGSPATLSDFGLSFFTTTTS